MVGLFLWFSLARHRCSLLAAELTRTFGGAADEISSWYCDAFPRHKAWIASVYAQSANPCTRVGLAGFCASTCRTCAGTLRRPPGTPRCQDLSSSFVSRDMQTLRVFSSSRWFSSSLVQQPVALLRSFLRKLCGHGHHPCEVGSSRVRWPHGGAE